MRFFSRLLLNSAALLAALGTSSCALNEIGGVGRLPVLNPVAIPGSAAERAVLVPETAPGAEIRQANALWRPGSRAFFRDPRAAKVGDIITVNIAIGDQATIANTSTQTRESSQDANLSNFLGFESKLANVFPDAVDADNLAGFGSGSAATGTGTVNRSEEIDLTVAAVVTQVLPNGNLVIQGRQEVRVNYEVRELTVSGIVRPEDISNANTIDHTQIAEARISYGGRGDISDVQTPRYGHQLFDFLFPF